MEEQPFSVLLVDDDADACAIFRLVMNHHHLALDVVRDAESALEYLKIHTPDIIVMDIFLPGLDGYQALKQIRKAALAPGCRVIATTAYYTTDTRDEALGRGFDGYIAKPFQSHDVVPYLRSVLANRQS